MAQQRSAFKAFCFLSWTCLCGILTWTPIFAGLNAPVISLVAILLPSLSLQAFLIYKTTAALRLLSPRTNRLDEFFYGEANRKGSLALLALCVLWEIDLTAIAGITVLDLWVGGPVSSSLNTLAKSGGKASLALAYAVYIVCAVVFIALMLWVLWTAVRALWKIAAPVKRVGEEEDSVPLVSANEGQRDEDKDS